MAQLAGQTALITGGGSGIGLATARLLLESGANVVIAGRTASKLQDVAAQLNGADRLKYFTADISSEGHAKTLVSHVVHAFGALNILINNAGVFSGGKLIEMEEDDFDYVVDINLKGTWFMCRYAARPMADAGGGVIVNVSSYLAKRAHKATPCSAYAAAKAGVLGLTRALAVELAAHKIRVNAVLPALVNTPMLTELVQPGQIELLLERSSKAHPIGRNGEPEDVARAIVFLCKPENDWLSGIEMPIDGGRAVL
jgi:NAD(P)-dependent dehydrogenase (short-subunit alcohol dehydrogenase family)